MWDLLYYAGAAIVGGVAGYFIGKAISKYLEKALNWFEEVKKTLSRLVRAAGILIRNGNRLYKRFVAQLSNGEIEEYYDQSDDGVEIEWDDLTEEAKKALQEDEYIVVANYEA